MTTGRTCAMMAPAAAEGAVLEQFQVLRDVAARLGAAGIPYMITGSVAMSHYAQPRMTRDIDVVVELAPEDAARLGALFGADYHLDVETARREIGRHGMFNLIHLEQVVKVDLIVRKDTEYRRLEFDRRRRVEVEGTSLYIASPEDLLLSKLEWARESGSAIQLGDVRNLASSVEDLDWAYVRRWAEALGLGPLLGEVAP